MKQTMKRGLFYVIVGFCILFVLRLIYGYIAYPDDDPNARIQTQPIRWDAPLKVKNFASQKLKVGTPQKGTPTTVDQKYEKVGTLTSRSTHFEHDESQLRTLIEEYEMLIQFEQQSGLAGYRRLQMALGVFPEKFDQVMTQIQQIGILVSLQIDKSDKTNEYKELEAKKRSLEKTREALVNLKGQGGSIKELIELENRILDIENTIQNLGVRIGEFDEEHEFCTIKFILVEVKKRPPIPISQRLKVAFEWTVAYYLRLLAICCIGILLSFLFVSLVQKIQALQLLQHIQGGQLSIRKIIHTFFSQQEEERETPHDEEKRT